MEINRRDLFKGALAASVARINAAPLKGYLKPVQEHLEKLITSGLDVYGPVKTAMWMASLDTRTGRYPDQPFAAVGQRVYREIAAPRGSSIYWDQPEMVAAYSMSTITADPRFRNAVDAYVRDFLARGIDENGLWEWGNHRYYDAFTDKPVHFSGGPHEIRPLTPAWDIFWKLAPEATEREIRVTGKRHLFDPAIGGFNRHDDGKKGDAFLEAGGVLIESLCWLSKKTKDRSLVDDAMRIARFSFGFRNNRTGLVENQPTQVRWDKFVSTTEVGLWAGDLLRASDLSNQPEFFRMADEAMTPYLHYGYDPHAGEFYGQVNIEDGKPPVIKPPDNSSGKLDMNYRHKADGSNAPDAGGDYPARYANIWNAQFPSHDYPMAFAEACVELYRRTKAPRYREAVERWAGVVKRHPAPTTARDGKGAYAEMFGRAIYFLADAGVTLSQPEYTAEARELAGAAVDILFAHGMFRSHAGEDRYDAVDGVGYLLLALIFLETGRKPDLLGFGI
jgi:hypothetical protein